VAQLGLIEGSVDSNEAGTSRSNWYSATPIGFAHPAGAYSATSQPVLFLA
jgi:hypothetical protein